MTLPQYSYVSTPGDISFAFAELAGGGTVALDLEAAGLHRYRDSVCLVQAARKGKIYVIDPLAKGADITPLGAILADPSTRKVFHGCDYDVRLLKRDYGFTFRSIFDTMIASQFLGRKAIGLAALLMEEFGVLADKKFQKADWSARPISEGMLAYAALDVAYLEELADRLERALTEAGRLEWAKEEFALLENAEPSPLSPPSALEAKGAGKFTPRQCAVLQALLDLRDRTAQKWDRPPFKVLPGDLLLTWAVTPPKSKKELFETKGASERILGRLSGELMEAIETALALPPGECPVREEAPRFPPMTGEEKERLAKLKAVRTKRSEELLIDPGLLVNTATLEKVARAEPGTEGALLNSLLKNWQKEAVGSALAALTEAAVSS
ncbi:ribonuclease D [bacterium]|nr:MAG: ribonuclease D [bacterium]